jgi:hypothetical protein
MEVDVDGHIVRIALLRIGRFIVRLEMPLYSMKLVVRNGYTAVARNDPIDIPHNVRRGGNHEGDRHALQDCKSSRDNAIREDGQRRGTGVGIRGFLTWVSLEVPCSALGFWMRFANRLLPERASIRVILTRRSRTM